MPLPFASCLAALFPAATSGAVWSGAHPDSLSSSRLVVEEREVRLALRCQLLSLAEVIPDLDADGDGRYDAREVAARRAEVFAYVAEHYRLYSGSDRRMRGGERLAARGLALHVSPGSGAGGLGWDAGAVDVELLFSADEPVEDLLLEVTLFHGTSPDHVDLATIVWPGGQEEGFALAAEHPRARSDLSGRGALGAYFRLGIEHILSGWDHLAFLLALLLGASSLRGLVGIVTAFTLAHSVTLGLAATGVVDARPWSGAVELVIALSIAYVAADNLLHRRRPRPRAVEAFVFGLVHGLGFAGYLAGTLLRERSKLGALLGFNLGVEAGQLAVVCALTLPFLLRRPKAGGQPSFLVPIAPRLAASALTCLLGLYWFGERVAG